MADPAPVVKEKKKDKEEPKLLKAEPGATKSSFAVQVLFPVYSIAFTSNNVAVLAGGGGSSRTGVKNRLSMYNIDTVKRELDLVTMHELSKEEDAPMTVACLGTKDSKDRKLVAGINSSVAELEKGVNNNLRLFDWDETSITSVKSVSTLSSTNPDHYQKVTAFTRPSSSKTMVAIGSTNSQLSLLSYPELEDVWPSISYENDEEVYDVDFSDDGAMLVATSSTKLCVWDTQPALADEVKVPLQLIERPALKKDLACTFRAAKFGRGPTSASIYTVVNASPAVRSKRPGPKDRKAFVSLWDTEKWKIVRTRTVSMRPVTAFDISNDGTLLAYGSSDLSVGVLSASNLGSLITVLHAHSFPVTTLKFAPDSRLVLTGSADNTVRVIPIEANLKEQGMSKLLMALFTVLILLLAVYVQYSGVGDDVRKVAAEQLNL